jgi:LCP family protein required for cell wall assembly
MKKKIIFALFSIFIIFIFFNPFTRLIFSALSKNQYQGQDSLNILILGLDPRNDQLEQSNTTDTIILASLNLETATTSLISLPRDLWYYPLSVKINQIYPLSLDHQPDQVAFIQDHFSRLTGQKIDNTLILTTQDLINFVDVLGGVDVNLDSGFTDEQFPNPDYIKKPSPEIPVYITISFPSGQNHLDQSNVAYFVRSRKNAQTAAEGGTDLGRTQRQQLLIEAIIQKIKDNATNPVFLKTVYNFYHQQIQTNFSDQNIINLLLRLKKRSFDFNLKKITIPAGENPKTDIIYYPGHLFQGQWVFLPQDEEYQLLHQFIKDSL